MSSQLDLPLKMGRIRAAKLENSERLQRVRDALACGRWLSTRDLLLLASVCAVNSCAAELRDNGLCILRRCVGQGRYEYRWQPGVTCRYRRARCAMCEHGKKEEKCESESV